MEAVLEPKRVWEQRRAKKDEKRVGFLTGLFGCWHKELSRPFTTQRKSYRVCLNCGARKHFDPQTLQTYGAFYFPLESEMPSQRR